MDRFAREVHVHPASYHASDRHYVETHGYSLAGMVLDKSSFQTDPLG